MYWVKLLKKLCIWGTHPWCPYKLLNDVLFFLFPCPLREYDPDATMTSRFGKTYSRKGGEGTSKFDEVLSTKRGTLSTKWGDTTYKAKVGSKRVGAPKSDSVLGVYKRPRPSEDGLEDPFGFDSDEESKPVSSRSGNKSSPAKPASAEPPQAERPGISLDTGSRSSLQGGSNTLASTRGASWLPSDRNQPRVLEDTARFFNSSSASIGNTQNLKPSSLGRSGLGLHPYLVRIDNLLKLKY